MLSRLRGGGGGRLPGLAPALSSLLTPSPSRLTPRTTTPTARPRGSPDTRHSLSSSVHFDPSPSRPRGPHSSVATSTKQEAFVCKMFDRLWDTYRARVSYVRTYESLVAGKGATFFNDHIALRTIALQDSRTGISSISRLFEALGYRSAECYNFEDKHLAAVYFQHPHPKLPKLFVSELKTWELSEESSDLITKTLFSHHPDHVNDTLLRRLNAIGSKDMSDAEQEALLMEAVACLEKPAWNAVDLEDVRKVHKESQYGAWVLVHGYNVNHFTSLINSHKVQGLDDIESTTTALKNAGVPMKGQIEGDKGTSLRQTATEAVEIDVPVMINGQMGTTKWPYAYFEFAQRDSIGGAPRYEGFKSTQATHLFEMTQHEVKN